jgi:Cu-Zn family superoxide dismutase
MERRFAWVLALSVLVLVSACGRKEEAPAPAAEPEIVIEEAAPLAAVAILKPRADSEASGTVTFTEIDGGVEVVADVARVSPGLHGIHLHEVGDCSAEDFTSTGGHFNPADVPHGGPSDAVRHAGDFGNIEIGEDGTGRLRLTTDLLTVSPGPDTVVGRAVILHEGADDLESQPTGAAGGRIACGVVRLAGEEWIEEVEETTDKAELES